MVRQVPFSSSMREAGQCPGSCRVAAAQWVAVLRLQAPTLRSLPHMAPPRPHPCAGGERADCVGGPDRHRRLCCLHYHPWPASAGHQVHSRHTVVVRAHAGGGPRPGWNCEQHRGLGRHRVGQLPRRPRFQLLRARGACVQVRQAGRQAGGRGGLSTCCQQGLLTHPPPCAHGHTRQRPTARDANNPARLHRAG